MSEPAHQQRFAESVVWINQMIPELNFQHEELGYKITSANDLAAARRLLLAGEQSWPKPFVQGLKHSNQLNWRVKDDLITIARQHPEHLVPLLKLLWREKLSAIALNTFVDRLHALGGAFTTGVSTSVASVILMALSAEDHPSYRPEAVRNFWSTVRWPQPASGSTPFEKYNSFRRSLREFMAVANSNGLAVPNLLTAQGYMWLITTYDPRTVLPAPALATFRAWRGDSYTGLAAEAPTSAHQRDALITALAEQPDCLFSQHELEQFTVDGEPVPLVPAQGISVSRPGSDIPVAVTLPTTITAAGLLSPLSDDGMVRCRLTTGGKPTKPDEGLLRALEARVPVILLVATAPIALSHLDKSAEMYQAIFPVYVHRYSRLDTSFEFDLSQAYTTGALISAMPQSRVYERRWASGMVQRRLHQPLFRRDVLTAYDAQCAVCGLNIVELLDAAHILPDRHELGVAWVRNGMALCKNHHAAFDANLLAVSPELTISIAPPLLSGSPQAPATRDAVSNLEGAHLVVVPTHENQRPHPDHLRDRFAEFQRKWSIPPAP